MGIKELGSDAYRRGEQDAYASCLRLFAPDWEAVAKVRAEARRHDITGLPSKRELRKAIRAELMGRPKEWRRCRACASGAEPLPWGICKRERHFSSAPKCPFWSPVIPN